MPGVTNVVPIARVGQGPELQGFCVQRRAEGNFTQIACQMISQIKFGATFCQMTRILNFGNLICLEFWSWEVETE